MGSLRKNLDELKDISAPSTPCSSTLTAVATLVVERMDTLEFTPSTMLTLTSSLTSKQTWKTNCDSPSVPVVLPRWLSTLRLLSENAIWALWSPWPPQRPHRDCHLSLSLLLYLTSPHGI